MQQLAVVELAFVGQIQPLVKALRHGGFHFGQLGTVQGLRCGQCGQSLAGAGQQGLKALGLGHVLPVPKNQRAFLLEKNGLCQCAQQFRPAVQCVLAHGHHVGFCDRRLGQRGQHGSGHARGGVATVGRARIHHTQRVARLRQRHRQQTAHEASAQNQHRGT